MEKFIYLEEVKQQFFRHKNSKEKRYAEAEKLYREARSKESEMKKKYKAKLLEQAKTEEDMSEEINALFDKMHEATKEADKRFSILEAMEEYSKEKDASELPFDGQSVTDKFNEYKDKFIEEELKQVCLEYVKIQDEIREKLDFLYSQANATKSFLYSVKGGQYSNGYDIGTYAVATPDSDDLYIKAFGEKFKEGFTKPNPLETLYN